MTGVGTSNRTSLIARVGLTFQLLLAVPYLLSGLFAPLWMAIGLWTVWMGLLAVAMARLRSHPTIVPVIPLVAAAVWALAALMTVG